MSLDTARGQDQKQRFPRVSGDEPPNAYGEDYVREFSPRERG